MTEVQSTAIKDISYDEEYQRLFVTFHNGRSYQLENVPRDVYDEFVAADSKGRFFNERIKGQYK